MEPIRALRERAALSQQALARAAGTSQPTIAAYEAGTKSPTVETVHRLAESVGLQATINFSSPLTREDRRSLALHRAIARRLTTDPEGVISVARRNLRQMQAREGQATQLLREWEILLDRPPSALVEILADTGEWARELRHVTPFAGVLSPAERTRAYQSFARQSTRRK
jgi:transcriptional regulator with XRE-family HTH domain